MWRVTMLGTISLLGLAVAAVAAEKDGLSATERRRLLLPVYERVRQDAGLVALEPGRLGRMNDAAAVEAYLRALPLSPRELLQIDMDVRRYEVAVPRFLEEWHVQWMRLHELEARKLYGSALVDAKLSGRSATPLVHEGGEESSLTLKAAGLDANLAATSVPAPEEYQGEVQIAANPLNTAQVVAAANTWDAMAGACAGGIQAVFYSSDGGVTWNYTCAPGVSAYPALGACAGTVFGSDPALSWNDANEVFLNYMLLCSAGFSLDFSLVVAKSSDGGATWSGQGVVKNSWNTANIEDKNFYAIDNSPSSPYYGRHYVCWDRNNNEKLAYSSDGGTTWTEVNLPDVAGSLDLGCDVAVQKNGKVHVAFDTLTCGAVNCTNERLFYTKSTDGGATWTAALQLRDYNLTGFSGTNCPDPQDDRCIGPFGAIDVDRSGGACNDNLFVTYTDFDAGGTVDDSDVWVIRSTDNGASWGAPVRVNDGGYGLTGEAQFNATLAVDQYDGEVVVAFQDARLDPNNREVTLRAATSRDCGLTFGNDVKLTSGGGGGAIEFNNNTIGYSDENTIDNVDFNPNQYGEYIGLDVQGSKAYVAWTDTRHFFPAFTTESQKENIAADTLNLLKPVVVKTVKSINVDDGYVLEQTETSSTGGSTNSTLATTAAIRAGDSASDLEYRGILSFSTLDIPEAATIQSVRLRIKRGQVVGLSPFATHGTLTVDANTAGFNGDLALENADWEAAATALGVCTLPEPVANGDWTECFFNAAGIAAIHTNGRTQVRIHFTTGDNDDLAADYMGFYSGNSASDTDRPELIVTYQ